MIINRKVVGGGGETPSVYTLMKASLESEGFVLSEFSPASISVSSGYITVLHDLGRVPVDVIAFRKEWVVDSAGYLAGCVTSSNFGQDNDYNRSYITSTLNTYYFTSALFSIISNSSPNAPILYSRTLWNFCKSANSTGVEIRNQSGGSATKMLDGDWVLAVR